MHGKYNAFVSATKFIQITPIETSVLCDIITFHRATFPYVAPEKVQSSTDNDLQHTLAIFLPAYINISIYMWSGYKVLFDLIAIEIQIAQHKGEPSRLQVRKKVDDSASDVGNITKLSTLLLKSNTTMEICRFVRQQGICKFHS